MAFIDDVFADYREIFGRDPEPWREPLGALRLTLTGDPCFVDVMRAQNECEELVRILNERSVIDLSNEYDRVAVITELRRMGYTVGPGGK